MSMVLTDNPIRDWMEGGGREQQRFFGHHATTAVRLASTATGGTLGLRFISLIFVKYL